jgi:hypothetical protein
MSSTNFDDDIDQEMDIFSLLKTKHNICATRCCICHKELKDPSSIEFGIGPTCRRNGQYDDAPTLSNEQIENVKMAIEIGFPEKIATDLLNLVVS